MTAQLHHNSATKVATNAHGSHNNTNADSNLSTYNTNITTSSTDKKDEGGTQIELAESPGPSQVPPGTDDKDRAERATLGWTPWRRDRDRKMKGDDGREPLEQVRSNEELLGDEELAGHTVRRSRDGGIQGDDEEGGITGDSGPIVWKVYKRRWFGLAQLVLLNVVVSWDVSSRRFHSIPLVLQSSLYTHLTRKRC